MYPTQFPIAELTNVINTIKNGQVKENLKIFAHDLWVLQGYAQANTIGNPIPVLTQSMETPLETLEKILNIAQTPSPQALSLNPFLIQLLKIAIQELMEALQDYIGSQLG